MAAQSPIDRTIFGLDRFCNPLCNCHWRAQCPQIANTRELKLAGSSTNEVIDKSPPGKDANCETHTHTHTNVQVHDKWLYAKGIFETGKVLKVEV